MIHKKIKTKKLYLKYSIEIDGFTKIICFEDSRASEKVDMMKQQLDIQEEKK